jgi:DNA invertase Pin-like site-specific DNA recombinase
MMPRGRTKGQRNRNSTADGHYYAKLAKQNAGRIFDLHAKENMMVTAIAERFHVAPVTISRILEAERKRRDALPPEPPSA